MFFCLTRSSGNELSFLTVLCDARGKVTHHFNFVSGVDGAIVSHGYGR